MLSVTDQSLPKACRVPCRKTGVLLVHGLCGTPTEMRFIANGLARAGAEVSCPTLAGHCGTEADLTATTWRDWYASAEAALLDLCQRCDRVIVGGLSTGAVLGLMLAVRLVGPIEPATNRGLFGFLAVNSSATSRAILADWKLSS